MGTKEEEKAYSVHYADIYEDIMENKRVFDNVLVRPSGYTDKDMMKRVFDDLTYSDGGCYESDYDYLVRSNTYYAPLEKKEEKKKRSVSYRTELSFAIEKGVNQRIQQLVNDMSEDSLEIGGLLRGKMNDEGTLVITDMVTLQQKTSSSDFEVDEQELSNWMQSHMFEEGFEEWIGWWHSHHNLGLFWSATDDEMFETLTKDGKSCFGIVYVKGGESLSRYEFTNEAGRFVINNVELEEIGEAEEEATVEAYSKETIQKCVVAPQEKRIQSVKSTIIQQGGEKTLDDEIEDLSLFESKAVIRILAKALTESEKKKTPKKKKKQTRKRK